MESIEFRPNLMVVLEKNELRKVYILTGERGLGKHSMLRAVEDELRAADLTATNIILIHPDELSFSLWPIENALRRVNPNIELPNYLSNGGLNYTDQLIRNFIDLCNGHSRTIIFLYRLHMFNTDLWAFISRLFRLLLDPYRSMNVCFCCCLHTDEGLQCESTVQLHDTQQVIDFFARYARNTSYLYFKPWPPEALHQMLEQDLFQGNLYMAPGQKELLIDAAMGNPATLINLTERMKIRGLFYQRDGRYHCADIDSTTLLSCGPVLAKEQYKRLESSLQEMLRGSSVIGVEFEAKLLTNPLEFQRVEDKLKRLISISRIVQQKVDDLYEFESIFSQLSIRDYVSKDELILWNSQLGDYF